MGPDYTAMVSALRDEIMAEIHGLYWTRQLPLGQGSLRPSSKAMLRQGGGATARTLAAGFTLAAEADGGGQVLPALPEVDGQGGAGGWGGGAGASLNPVMRGPASAAGRLEREDEPFEFAVTAGRRGTASVAGSLMGVRRSLPPMMSAEERAAGLATPGAAPVQDSLPLPLLSGPGQAHAELFAPDGSEASREILERTTRLRESMREEGFASEEVELSVQIEFYMRDLADRWQEDAGITGSTEAISVWAMRQLLSQKFEDVVEFTALEAQVRALSRLAGLAYAEATEQLNRIWYSTPAGSAARRSQGSGRIRSSHFSTPKRTTPDRAGRGGGAGAASASPAGTPAPQVKREAEEPSSSPSRNAPGIRRGRGARVRRPGRWRAGESAESGS